MTLYYSIEMHKFIMAYNKNVILVSLLYIKCTIIRILHAYYTRSHDIFCPSWFNFIAKYKRKIVFGYVIRLWPCISIRMILNFSYKNNSKNLHWLPDFLQHSLINMSFNCLRYVGLLHMVFLHVVYITYHLIKNCIYGHIWIEIIKLINV